MLVVPGLEDSQGNRMGDSPISAAVQATELTLARLRRRYKRALSYADLYADENDGTYFELIISCGHNILQYKFIQIMIIIIL